MDTPSEDQVSLARRVKFPESIDGFRQWISSPQDAIKWCFEDHPEVMETKDESPVVAVLAGAEWPSPYISFERGYVSVNMDETFQFGLDELFRDWPDWTWQRQMSNKTWCTPEHIRFLDAITDLALRQAART
ncbi:hypothetical protein ABI_14310 [Asticcacaulis biprosthecium C19]|uniref:Uncharacterized protein n=1 Tax=Asticcacaulis biprosthecium C19 TaxID=715226 RepID=F4QIK3_9CAUL|nr:hypothetical protein [Asticcacaulis biprosthecium]EGF92992.1 hypothetical protein ABI_14310 [Asticcacaulis biprosthecium C19]